MSYISKYINILLTIIFFSLIQTQDLIYSDIYTYLFNISSNDIDCEKRHLRKCHGYCVKSDAFCPTPISCNEGLSLINMYTCALEQDYAPPSKCEADHECWDNTCIDDPFEYTKKCPTMTTCIEGKKRCSDNSCVDSTSECSNYVECPSFLPVRCPNGDCRVRTEDCPSLLTCPEKIPMKCNDESCHVLKENCKLSSESTLCSDKSLIRCPDGTCTNSKFLCPTPKTCPQGYEKCWTGNCALKGKCPDSPVGQSDTCDNDQQILCPFDFSCSSSVVSCPTGIICPTSKPVKCWDNSCAESLSQCPKYQECSFGMKSCPDGSCSLDTCGTHITCSLNAPFRCYDNTCRQNPEDCPEIPKCPSETPILCWDGRCLSSRSECLSPSKCSDSAPVKCPNGLCVRSGDQCEPHEGCPAEFTKCPSGICMKSAKHCNPLKCPINFPYKCKNGMCVSDKSLCEKDNGCPWNKPFKCFDGTCAKSDKNCPPETEKNKCKESNTRRCPDGSCLLKSVTCPSASGCPEDRPIKCADGTCIKNDGKEECPIPICPQETPVKCLDGTCVTSKASCPSVYSHSKEYPELVVCSDSTLAKNYEECKPMFNCPDTEPFRCQDGSCREEKDSCPTMENGCPDDKFRCESGECAEKYEKEGKIYGNCRLLNGCNALTPIKCSAFGVCVSDPDDCSFIRELGLANGCSPEKPIKCLGTRKCVTAATECSNLDGGCGEGEVMCPDGKCTKNPRKECKAAGCKEAGKIECPADTSAKCADKFEMCYNRVNCKLTSPFRCVSGECRRFPHLVSGASSIDSCPIGIQCPQYKPYLCLDGSCREKLSFCPSIENCPPEIPFRCFDRTCVRSEAECDNGHTKCPAGNPILCPNGNCVNSIFDCAADDSCPRWIPFKCVTGECTSNPRQCTLMDVNGTLVYGSMCKEDEYQCYDGSCRPNYLDCPIFEGCTTTEKPYKCLDGSCVENKDKCKEKEIEMKIDNNYDIRYISNITCLNSNETLCEDGICRLHCHNYNGCPNDKPLMCPSNLCVRTISECVGFSSCLSSENSFRCPDGACVSKMSECKNPLRGIGNADLIVSVFPKNIFDGSIVIGNDNVELSRMKIGADSFFVNGKSGEAKIYIKSIARNEISDTFTKYNETRQDDITVVFPYSDAHSEGKIEYEFSVLSTVLNITVDKEKEIEWRNPILLTLMYDFPSKHEAILSSRSSQEKAGNSSFSMPLDMLKDICLGKLDIKKREWKCTTLPFSALSLESLQLEAAIKESGIYAVILSPRINTRQLMLSHNFFIEHLAAICITTLILLIVISLSIYVFFRLYRYRQKYKRTMADYERLEEITADMYRRSTKILGETFEDMEEGIIYTNNPSYKKKAVFKDDPRQRQLEVIYDKFRKKLKALERNNQTLNDQQTMVKDEIKRLKEYKEYLMKPNINAPDKKRIKQIGPEDINKYGSIMNEKD